MSYLAESDGPASRPDPGSAIAWLGDLKRVSTWPLQGLAASLCKWGGECPSWEKQHCRNGVRVTAAGLWPLRPWAGASGVTLSATPGTLCPLLGFVSCEVGQVLCVPPELSTPLRLE